MDSKRRCKITDQISGSQSHGGVRRTRDTDITSSGSDKKRKFDHRDQENVIQLESHCRSGEIDVNLGNDVVSPARESGSCDHVSSSSCFENDLSLDLKAELRFESETSMCSNDGFSKGTSTASSEICLDSNNMESSSTLKKQPSATSAAASCRKPVTVSNCPSAVEIDEFFSIAEKEKKRFMDKYNYDIVNDVPMEGRYQWVRLKP